MLYIRKLFILQLFYGNLNRWNQIDFSLKNFNNEAISESIKENSWCEIPDLYTGMSEERILIWNNVGHI